MFRKPALQVALDLTDLNKAIELAALLATNLPKDHLIIEAGTPLIKSWGVLAPRLLKNITGATVFADTKTMDTGALEARLMIDNGADIVSVLSVSSEDTIKEFIGETHTYGKLAAVDLINNPTPIEIAIKTIDLGADIIIYHVGIDVQIKRGITVADLIDEIKYLIRNIRNRKSNAFVAVAGGLKPGLVSSFIDAGVDIVIVGSAITKSSNPLSVSRELLSEMRII